MNKQGEMGTGTLIIVFIGIIVSLVLLSGSFGSIEQTTQPTATSVVNYSITGIKDTPVALAGQELVSVTNVRNATTGAIVPTVNYTIAECIRPTDGLKGICYTALDACNTGNPSACGGVKVTYSYYKDGYADDAATRTIIGLIILLAAIGIALWVLKPILEEKGVFG